MSITTTPQTTDQATSLAEGLRQLATFVEANPRLSAELAYALSTISDPILADDARSLLADITRATLAAGGTVEKYYNGDYAGIDANFGPVRVKFYTGRAEVCERVVVGTREVEEQVPDPEALAAVPVVTVTKTVEDVKWVCTPLLAEATDDAQSGRAA